MAVQEELVACLALLARVMLGDGLSLAFNDGVSVDDFFVLGVDGGAATSGGSDEGDSAEAEANDEQDDADLVEVDAFGLVGDGPRQDGACGEKEGAEPKSSCSHELDVLSVWGRLSVSRRYCAAARQGLSAVVVGVSASDGLVGEVGPVVGVESGGVLELISDRGVLWRLLVATDLSRPSLRPT